MSANVTGKIVVKNISLSIFVQIVSALAGIVINLIVPKFIDTYQYAYWQSFLLYMQYVGFFHFGFIDGLVLRYSQYDYNELNKDSVRNQYYFIILIDIGIAVMIIISALLFFNGVTKILCILFAISIFSEISYNYILTLFQTTNRIKEYAKYVIFYRITYCLLLIMCMVFQLNSYYWLCLAYICADLVGVFTIGLKYNRSLVFGKILSLNKVIKDLKKTLSGGVKLMLASYSAILLVGIGKIIIQWKWNTVTFGKVSLAYSMTSFILQFVVAISVVLFPSIKRIEKSQLPKLYKNIRITITPLLYFSLILYFPGSYLLRIWLPMYKESLLYLGVLFPMIIFTSKTSLLINNYLNAYRKEKILLIINLTIVGISLFIYLIESFLFENIVIILGTIVFAVMMRAIICEIIVLKYIKVNLLFDIIWDILITIIFLIAILLTNKTLGFLIYLITIFLYFILKRKEIIYILKKFFNKLLIK